MNRFRNRRQQRRHLSLDGVDHRECICTRLTLDQQQLRRLAVMPGAGSGLLRGIDGLADVFDADWRTVAISHNDLAEGQGIEKLVVGVEGVDLVLAFEVALGFVERGGGQRVMDIL